MRIETFLKPSDRITHRHCEESILKISISTHRRPFWRNTSRSRKTDSAHGKHLGRELDLSKTLNGERKGDFPLKSV